jgi:hypothetical protein
LGNCCSGIVVFAGRIVRISAVFEADMVSHELEGLPFDGKSRWLDSQ